MARFALAFAVLGCAAGSECQHGECANPSLAHSLLQGADSLKKLQVDIRDVSETEDADKSGPTVNVFRADAVENILPRAPPDYPDPLQGIIWMDQSGYYGYSSISDGAPDACVSFGDPNNVLDWSNKKIDLDVSGSAFQWFNNVAGYAFWKLLHSINFKYIFQWNDDYTHADITPSVSVFSVPKSFAAFTMELQTPPAGQCPPSAGATKEEISKCAKWKRVSNVLGGKTKLYYAFEIIDKAGNRVQPYYDKYVEWVTKNADGDEHTASWAGVRGAGIEDAGTSFVGLDSIKGVCDSPPPEEQAELAAATRNFVGSNPLYAQLANNAEGFLNANGQKYGAGQSDMDLSAHTTHPTADPGASPGAGSTLYNPWGFCPLKTHSDRLDAASSVGGTIRKMAQLFNEFNIWIWSDGEDRPINPATDVNLVSNGPLGASKWAPTWANLRTAGLVLVLLPTLLATDGGNRTSWFMQSAQTTCWNPSPLGSGPMIFRFPEVAASLADSGQRRGYYTATVPQVADFFDPELPLFLDGPRHRAFRDLLEFSSFSRRYKVDVDAVKKIPRTHGCKPPEETAIAGYVGPLVAKAIWGADPTPEALTNMMTYAKYGKFAIFGEDIHKVLKPVGVAAKVKDSRYAVTEWAKDTAYGKLILQARDHLYPAHPWFMEDRRLIDHISTATLFAGMVGTTDMTLKCVKFQKRDARHQSLFLQDPEKYLVELMRYDSAVTSVTALLKTNETYNLEGRNIQLLEGTPAQLVLATANRDPTHWNEPEKFNPWRTDLADTLAWNGKADAVEARDLEQAPRHCPGFCLSVKIAAAVCAGVMGSFDDLKASGKILKDDGEVQCNNFGDRQESAFWSPSPEQTDTKTTPAPVPDEQPVLMKKDHECGSSDYYVGKFDTLGECVNNVKAAGGKFFIYGYGLLKNGYCYIEYTANANCPEGYQSDWYNFYDIPEIALEDALMGHANVVEVSVKDGSGRQLQSGIFEKGDFQNQKVWLGAKEGKYGHPLSFVRHRICNREYRLAVQSGSTGVETWQACCDTSYWNRHWCQVPATLQRESVKALEGDTTFSFCHEPEDSKFDVTQATYTPLTPRPARDNCVKVAAVSKMVSLRQLVNQCPAWVKLAIQAAGALAASSWESHRNSVNDNDEFHILERTVGKDPDSSTLDPLTFDKFTVGMFIAVVHMSGKNMDNGGKPASERLSLPNRQRYLDRYTAYNFIGMPTTEIDGGDTAVISTGMACVVDAIRSLAFADDHLDQHNSWDKILGDTPGIDSHCPNGAAKCNKMEFIRGAYDKYTTGDGIPLYPLEQAKFRERWLVGGAWKDEAETFMAWQHYGSHHLRKSQLQGTEFVLRSSELAQLAVRPGYSQVGADMYFDASGAPVMIETPAGMKLWRQSVDARTWQYWKFVWRSSLFLKVTLVDHLWSTHFTAANSLSGAAREALAADHPMRRLLTMFTYGTIKVNNNAFHQLLGPRALLHRSTPFTDFKQITQAARASIPSLRARFEPFVNPTALAALPGPIQRTPFLQDGQVMFTALKRLVDSWWGTYPEWCQDGTLVDQPMLLFFRRIGQWSMYQQDHFENGDEEFLNFHGPDGESIRCEGAQLWLTIHFFHVSGYHRHVGTVGESAADPDFAGFSWFRGEAFTRPREALQVSLIASSTATRWPKISEDYSFLAEGIHREDAARRAFSDFKDDMQQLKSLVEQRNKDRAIPYMNMHPDEVEISVAV